MPLLHGLLIKLFEYQKWDIVPNFNLFGPIMYCNLFSGVEDLFVICSGLIMLYRSISSCFAMSPSIETGT